MAWARVDDGFDDHPKILGLLEEDEHGVTAVGLWTLCLTWAHRNTRKKGKTPGLIPAGLPRRFLGPTAKETVKLLVNYGLWDEQPDGGWMIHDFDQYLPTEETKAARAEAGRRGAEKRWAGKRKADASAEPEDTKQTDGKLPSGGHDDASNDEANDGSRAPARRAISKEIAPTPTPIPIPGPVPAPKEPPIPPGSGAQTQQRATISGNDLLAEHVAACSARPPRQVQVQTGQKIDELLADDVSAEVIRGALSLLRSRPKLGPGILPNLAHEVATELANPPPPKGHQPFKNPDPVAYHEDL